VEARGQGRVGVHLGEVNAKRGSAGSNRVTPACSVRISRVRKSLQSGWSRSRPGRRSAQPLERHEGQDSPRGDPAIGEGKPLKAKTQGRYRHETRLERLRAE
jgi:hypothetical protein